MNTNGLEKQLDNVFGKQAPKMPEGAKKAFVKWMPILALIGAVLSVLGIWSTWAAATATNSLVKYANEISRVFGDGTTVSETRLTVWVWVALAFLVVNLVLCVMAYAPLKAHSKKGWNLVFYSSLVNVLYSVVTLFIEGNGIGYFITGLLVTAVGFWILFQIRPAYVKAAAVKASDSKAKSDKKAKESK